MEKTCNYNVCTGCGLCSYVCPKSCISFCIGAKGHLFPKIDTMSCIDCKKCVRVCPALNTREEKRPSKAYAAFTKDKRDYLTTTSGGAAQVLSKFIIENNGVVYGCAALPGVQVKHIRVDNISDLELLKGSKYVQSNILDIFPLVKKDIQSGVKVLFIGVPCQVAAILALFNKRPDNLLLVDLICHGVPSLDSLHDYLKKHVGDISKIEFLKFRTSRGFQAVASKSRLGSDTEEIFYESVPLAISPYGDEYYSPFFYGYSYRPSCYQCQFAKPERISDITIGDFWGLRNNELPDSFPVHQKGISVILPVSDKGSDMISSIKAQMYITERPVEEAIEGNKQLQHPTKRNIRIKVYELLSPYFGIKMSFKLTNLDQPLRNILRPYLLKLKKSIK